MFRRFALLCVLWAPPVCAYGRAELSLEITPLGRAETITAGGRLVGRGLHVRVVRPAWAGTVGAQDEGGGLAVRESTQDGARIFRGQFEAEGKPITFEQRVAPLGDGAAFRWRLTPSADIESELVVVIVELPTAGSAGQGEFYISDGAALSAHPLPAELPSPYHIAASESIAWCAWLLPGGLGLRMEPDGVGITGVSFQDNRQFGADSFAAQFIVRETMGLRAGRTYEFGLNLQAFTAADLAAEKQVLVDAAKALEWTMASAKPLALRGVSFSAQRVPLYGKLEATLDLDATYDNPFDARDIDVTATFTGPGGRAMVVPGFLYQGYEWFGNAGRTRLRVSGEPTWKVRFAPPEVGHWEVTVTARDRTGEVRVGPVAFECVRGDSRGYVRRVPGNPYYLQFDDGAPYFAVGENVCWGTTDQYAEWFRALGAAGGNYARIWLVRWNMGLEWTPGRGTGTYHGLGRYSQDNCFRLDYVMDQAAAHGIYVMLCLGYHGELMSEGAYFGEHCWDESPYNAANGGPCSAPEEFWTNEEARRAYKQRLRYLIARWGWDPHVLSWEFWNEVNAPAPWVAEMAQYVKEVDPYQHLVTTTYGDDPVWRVAEIDYTQAHTYGADEGRPETVPAIAALGREYTSRWAKPFMIGEFGIDFKTSDAVHDPKGLATSLHDGLWASVMTRCFGGAAIWYWDNYVHPNDLYGEFTSLRRFVDTIPWPELSFEFAEFGAVSIPGRENDPWGDIRVQGTLGWARQPDGDLEVRADGTIAGGTQFSEVVFSDSKPDMRAPLRFRVTYPEDGTLVLHVGTVSASALLRVLVDGEEVWARELLAGEGEGEWKSTRFYPEWDIWQSVYDKDYEVPIPAGDHVIEIENTGMDWVTVTSYTFTGCRDPRLARLDLLGLRTEDFAILWVHDPESNWYNDKYGRAPREIAGASFAIQGLADGDYLVEWWDTRSGEITATDRVRAVAGECVLAPPVFLRDIAARVSRVR